MITWTRSELKEKAKEGLHRNYWKSVLAGLLLIVSLSGVFSVCYSISIPKTYKDFTSDVSQQYEYFQDNPDWEDYEDYYNEFGTYTEPQTSYHDIQSAHGSSDSSSEFYYGLTIAFGMVVFLCVIMIAIEIALDVLLLNPLEAGVNRFMLINLHQPSDIKEVGYPYDRSYKNYMSTLFFRKLYTFLWGLLFVIPGIVKAYEYRMIPYLLIDNPQMSREEAFARSKAMMNGQKWNAFVLDLSFLGWNLLSLITLGIVGIFYVIPYEAMTDAALYERLRDGNPNQQQAGWNPQGPNGGFGGAQGQSWNNPNGSAQGQSWNNPNGSAQGQSWRAPNTNAPGQSWNFPNNDTQGQGADTGSGQAGTWQTWNTPENQSQSRDQSGDSAPSDVEDNTSTTGADAGAAEQPADSTTSDADNTNTTGANTGAAEQSADSAAEQTDGSAPQNSGANPVSNSENDNSTTTANP